MLVKVSGGVESPILTQWERNWHNLFGSTYWEADMCPYSLPISKREHSSKDVYQRGDQGYMNTVIQSSMMYNTEKLVKSKKYGKSKLWNTCPIWNEAVIKFCEDHLITWGDSHNVMRCYSEWVMDWKAGYKTVHT